MLSDASPTPSSEPRDPSPQTLLTAARAWVRSHPWLTGLLVIVAIVCTPWVQHAWNWGTLDWGTYWTAVGAIGTTGALLFAAQALQNDLRASHTAQDKENRQRHEEIERSNESRTQWAVSLDRRERLFAYRDLLIAQDARVTLMAARLDVVKAVDEGRLHPTTADEMKTRYDVDLDAARQQAWAAIATISLVSPTQVVDAAIAFTKALNKEVKASQAEKPFDEVERRTRGFSRKRGLAGEEFRALARTDFDSRLEDAPVDDDGNTSPEGGI